MESATMIGRGFGLGPQEINLALAEAGLQIRKHGAWALTELGKKYAEDTAHHRGPGGSSLNYNRYWETRRWDNAVTDLLGDLTPERKHYLRETVKAARRASRVASSEVAPAVASSVGSARDISGVALRGTSSIHTAVAVAAAFGLYRAGSVLLNRRQRSADTPSNSADPPAAEPGGDAGSTTNP